MTSGILEVHRTGVQQSIGRKSHTLTSLDGIRQVHHHGRYVDTITDDLNVEVGHIEDRLYSTGFLVHTDLMSDLHRIIEVRTERVAVFPSSSYVLIVRLGMSQRNDDTTFAYI